LIPLFLLEIYYFNTSLLHCLKTGAHPVISVTGYTRAVIRTTRRHVTTLATDRLYSHGQRTTLFFSLLSLCKYKNTVYSIVQSPRDIIKDSLKSSLLSALLYPYEVAVAMMQSLYSTSISASIPFFRAHSP
jgi:hypothetical protein